MRATCSAQYLGNLQACQYKILKKKDAIKSKGSFFTVTIFYNVKTLNENMKDLNNF
jgi:hypothetical protein